MDLRRMRVKEGDRLLGPERLLVPHPPAAFAGAGSMPDESCVPAFEHYSPGAQLLIPRNGQDLSAQMKIAWLP